MTDNSRLVYEHLANIEQSFASIYTSINSLRRIGEEEAAKLELRTLISCFEDELKAMS